MVINICGIPHEVIETNDNFKNNNCGMIDYIKCKIYINPELSEEAKIETLCHEIVHGMFCHLGYNDLAENETLVQGLANAIYQTFNIKEQIGKNSKISKNPT